MIPFLAVLILLHVGCAGLMPVQGPLWSLEEAHPSGTTCLAFDSTGERLASGGFQGEIIIWAMPSGRRLAKLKAHGMVVTDFLWGRAVRGLAWIDDSLLVSGAQNGNIVLWNVYDGRPRRSQKTPSPVTSLEFLRSRRLIVTGHKDGRIRAYTVPDLRLSSEFNMGGPVLSLAFDRETGRVAASARGGRLAILAPDLHLIMDLERAPRDAFEIRFSPDGRQLAGGAWFKLLFWDIDSGHVDLRDVGHWGAAISIDYSPDGKRLVSLGRFTDSGIRVFNLQTDTVERVLASHRLCGTAIRFSPDNRFVASGSDDGSVRLYDLSQPYQLK